MGRSDLLEFFRTPRLFAEGVAPETKLLWMAGLENFVIPGLAEMHEPPLLNAQICAWREAADERVALILGPPGTGKTFTLAWMALGYLEACRRAGRPCRILLTGFTHASIVNLMVAVLKKSRIHCPMQPVFAYVGWSPPVGLSDDVQTVKPGEAGGLLQNDYLILGSTSWGLYRLLKENSFPDSEGPTAPLFDLVCIDEASQMLVTQGLLCLSGLRPDGRVLVAGDNRQLPPVQSVMEQKVEGRSIGSSLYQFLLDAGVRELRLVDTFRLNAPLALFPAEMFYEGNYRPSAEAATRRLALVENWRQGLEDWEQVALDPEHPVCILLHDGPPASTSNPFEVALVRRLVEKLAERVDGRPEPEEFWRERLAVVSPHRAQNAAIRQALRPYPFGEEAVIATVDRVQGRERDAIIASYTVSDPEFAQMVGEFIFGRERFNVTITRARTKLILLVSRRLLEMTPTDEKVFECSRTLTEFVFSSERVGEVQIPGPDFRLHDVTVRVRRFDDSVALPELRYELISRPSMETLPQMTPERQALLDAIEEVAAASSFGSASDFELRKKLFRKVEFAELRALHRMGRIALEQRQSDYGAFWTATPLHPPRPVWPVDPDTVRERLDEAIAAARRGRSAPRYERVRQPFDWLGEDGRDRLLPLVELLAAEGRVEISEADGKLTVERVHSGEEEAPGAPAEPLSDDDFAVLNELEHLEARQIGFGIFERWTTVLDLAQALHRRTEDVSLVLLRLANHGHVLLTESGLVRTRMAELAREVRYVKQRFEKGDADRRPYLVRALKVALQQRDKPVRNQPLSKLREDMKAELAAVPNAGRVIDGIYRMLQLQWQTDDPLLSGFQTRAFRALLFAYMDQAPQDAFVITADTGAGKTEAACLPLIAGAAWDALEGRGGTRSILVYPRVRLAANQAQRLAGLLAALGQNEELPLLTLGMQNYQVPTTYQFADEDLWLRLGDAFRFPFFGCPGPGCNGELRLVPQGGVEGADLLHCLRCGWHYAGWVGTKAALRQRPPHLFLPVTESLHQWMQDSRYGRLFGDDPGYGPPRAILADEIHLYSHIHGAQIGYTLRRVAGRASLNGAARTLLVGMSATLGQPGRFWGEVIGAPHVEEITPTRDERQENVRSREYFFLVQPEVESRGKDVAGASATLQSLMCLAHGMRRRTGQDGGFRTLAFVNSIDKLKRLHSDYRDAEEVRGLAQLRTVLYPDNPESQSPRRGCCGSPDTCDLFRDGECWHFAATDSRQRTASGRYCSDQGLTVCEVPVFSGASGRIDERIQRSDIVFSTSSLEVGYDDPEITLVYQHYAPTNVASFVQRKGRGGRGADDRPITGVTLSVYSTRDAWFFRRPERLLDASAFQVPLNTYNYFVQRGQVLAVVLDCAARVWRRTGRVILPIPAEVFDSAAALVESVFGAGVLRHLEVGSVEELWERATVGRVLDPDRQPRDWGRQLPWVPSTLFQAVNLPQVDIHFMDGKGTEREATLEVSLALSEVAPGNATRRFGMTEAHWLPPIHGPAPLLRNAADRQASESFRIADDVTGLLARLPVDAQTALGESVQLEIVRPVTLRLERCGVFREADWEADWSYDAARQSVVPRQDRMPEVSSKSRGKLRGFLVVNADLELGRSHQCPGPVSACHAFFGDACTGVRTGLLVSHVYWGADADLVLQTMRKREEVSLYQSFVNTDTLRPELFGYQVEAEGVQFHLNREVLVQFVEDTLERVRGTRDEHWLRSQMLRYSIQSRVAGTGLSIYQAQQLAELLVSATGHPETRKALDRVLRRWDSAAFGEVIRSVYRLLLRAHPTMTDRRLESLLEAVQGNRSIGRVVAETLTQCRTDEAFRSYLRSVLLHGLGTRFHQAFVLEGSGEERNCLVHVHLPVQFGDSGCDAIITLAENCEHGDGTARKFLQGLEEALERTWVDLGRCPAREEDALLERVLDSPDRWAEWRSWNPQDPATAERLAGELGLAASGNEAGVAAVLRALSGSEQVAGERFDYFDLHREVRVVGSSLEALLEREPTVWELVSSVIERAAGEEAMVPRWTALLRAYEGIEEATSDGSLAAEARLAEQVYRLSARLCADGCPSCLHTGSDLMPDSLAEVCLSRRVLEWFADALAQRDAEQSKGPTLLQP